MPEAPAVEPFPLSDEFMPDIAATSELTEDPAPSMPPEGAGITPLSNDEFQHRVSVVMTAIEDPEKMRRCIAEIHTYLSMFEEGFREMQQAMLAGGGPLGMLKMMFGRGGKNA